MLPRGGRTPPGRGQRQMCSCCSSDCCLQKKRQAPLLRRTEVHLHNQPCFMPGRRKQLLCCE